MERRRKVSRPVRASTKDILGTSGEPAKRTPIKWREYFNALLQARNRLVQRRGSLVREASEEQPAYSLHMADAGTDTYDRDFALGIATSEQEALYEIDQAINRISEGSYGVCELTGKPIEAERLKAVPWTRFSAAAENELETNGVVKRARLGELSDLPKTSEPDRDEEDTDE
ncbi:MAG TPA: TraR/DksA C4-type zinc finger protein [Candidatus Binatia bacterium]|nr:TraR/DksA C4-type zinc finger protein [Candidatus Binatia bacterium]